MSRSLLSAGIAPVLALAPACADPPRREGTQVGVVELPVVYGDDDRREYFQLDDKDIQAWIERSMVALIPRDRLSFTDGGLDTQAPTWGEVGNVCPGEPFVTQPAAAFCSGVLVDRDLVLTAGHCLRAFALQDFVVVFGYYYSKQHQLATDPEDVFEPIEIIAEALDAADQQPRLDYGWIRLSQPATTPHEAASIRLRHPEIGEPILSIGTGGGLPIKSDDGARVTAIRSPWFDYFVADADTMRGSSGGVALNGELEVLGILSRGAPDLLPTEAGCEATRREPNADRAEEEFTFAARALERLCAVDATSSLCRSDCGDPCKALPPPPSHTTTCAVQMKSARRGGWSTFLAVLMLCRRRQKRGKRTFAA